MHLARGESVCETLVSLSERSRPEDAASPRASAGAAAAAQQSSRGEGAAMRIPQEVEQLRSLAGRG